MGFVMADLVVEATIRDGLENVRRDSTVLEDVFSPLTESYASAKYGISEIEKIKNFMETNEISVVHSFNQVNAAVPCVSIQLSDERESEQYASLGDAEGFVEVPFSSYTDSEERLADLIKVQAFLSTAYDGSSGIVSIDDAADLSQVHVNLLFVDAAGAEFQILGGIDNTVGSKKILIPKGETVTVGADCIIKSSLDFDLFPLKREWEQVTIILGIHTQDPNITKYLYTMVKYFLISRKDDICKRGVQLQTQSGSDFQRNQEYRADTVFTRFLNFSGFVLNSWREDKVQLIDHINVIVDPIDC